MLNKTAVITITLCLCLFAAACSCGGGTSASLATSNLEVKPGEEFELIVNINPGNRGISAVEISLNFDNSTAQVVDVAPGELLGERPLTGLFRIEAGTLAYSLARIGKTEAPTPAAVFAHIKCRLLESATGGDCQFNLTSVNLADENFKDIIARVQNPSVNVRIRH
jgi:hypothetical protein